MVVKVNNIFSRVSKFMGAAIVIETTSQEADLREPRDNLYLDHFIQSAKLSPKRYQLGIRDSCLAIQPELGDVRMLDAT